MREGELRAALLAIAQAPLARRSTGFVMLLTAIAAMMIAQTVVRTIASIAVAALVVLVVGETLLLAYAADVQTEHEIPRDICRIRRFGKRRTTIVLQH